MKKIIFAPTIFKVNTSLSDRVAIFFSKLSTRYNFDLEFTDYINTDSASLAIIYAGAHGHRLLTDSLSLRRATKIIYLLTGPHSFSNELIDPIMERASLVLCTYADFFSKKFPRFKGRFTFFPLYFAPHSRYTKLRIRKRPVMKCLLTGHSNPHLYPIRYYVQQSVINEERWQKYVTIMRHPRWQTNLGLRSFELPSYLNESYPACLNKYFCSLATASRYKYAIAKYFEIPASGSLLLAERIPDIDAIGFTPWEHYIPINKENVLEQIKFCSEYPADFESIREGAKDYVRANHSINNRLKQLGALMKEL